MKSLTFSGGGEGGTPPEELAYYSQRYFIPDLSTPADFFFDAGNTISLGTANAYMNATFGNGSGALVYTDVVNNRSVVILCIFAFPSSPPPTFDVYDGGGLFASFTPCVSGCQTTTCVEYDMATNSVLESIQVAQCGSALNNCNFNLPADLNAIQSTYQRIYGAGVIVDNPSGTIYRVRNIYSCGGFGGATPSGDQWSGDISNVGATIIACP